MCRRMLSCVEQNKLNTDSSNGDNSQDKPQSTNTVNARVVAKVEPRSTLVSRPAADVKVDSSAIIQSYE